MKYHSFTYMSLLWLLGNMPLFGQAPNLELTLRYNATLSRYEVYALPDATQAIFNWGPSQISIVAPASVPDLLVETIIIFS